MPSLSLEVERYRRVIAKVDHLYKTTHRAWREEVGGDLTALHLMLQLMTEERHRLPDVAATLRKIHMIDDHVKISLDEQLNIRAAGTYLVKVEGDSMQGVGDLQRGHSDRGQGHRSASGSCGDRRGES